MPLATVLIRACTRRAAQEFERATYDPSGSQMGTLFGIIRKNRDTEYGRRYGFSAIRTVEEYRRQVPVVTYEDIREPIQRMTEGCENVLTAEKPIMFTRTSGTTGEPKYIPVTRTCRTAEHRSFAQTWVYHVLASHPKAAAAQVVSLVSPAVEGYTPGGLPYGSTSGCIYRNMPAIVRQYYAIPYRVFEISDYQAKYYVIMRLAMQQKVSAICTANPSSIVKMCEKGNEFGERIIRDIHDGTLCDDFAIEPEIRCMIQARLKPKPKTARFLESVRRKRKGLLLPHDYWRVLGVIGCWKGGTVGHYIDKFGKWFDPDGVRTVPVRDWGYLSSETRGSIAVTDSGSAGILTVTTSFYEFVPVEEFAALKSPGSCRFLTADQLEDGREYYVFVTTTGGLYRYNMNDIVRVEGFYNRTAQIVFVRKGRGMTNITGEKLSANQVIDAVRSGCNRCGLAVVHFRAEADVDNSRYVLRVEFCEPVGREKARGFLGCFDEHLKLVNIEYRCKRNSMRLADPVLHMMRNGWYDKDQCRRVENGGRAFQSKADVLVGSVASTGESELECIIRMTPERETPARMAQT